MSESTVLQCETLPARRGVHLIADLYGCDLQELCAQEEDLERLKLCVSSALREGGLKELGSYYHFFGPHAVTATVCLAESHLNFHSWPEDSYVSLDLFACGQSATSSERAEHVAQIERIFASFIEQCFHPTETVSRKIER